MVPSGRLALAKFEVAGHKNKLRGSFEVASTQEGHPEESRPGQNNGAPHPACPGALRFLCACECRMSGLGLLFFLALLIF